MVKTAGASTEIGTCTAALEPATVVTTNDAANSPHP
jgi:hypothetical protein